MECLRLRIKDVDFETKQITIRNGKGQKDRVTMLPERYAELLRQQVAKARTQFEEDLRNGHGEVYICPSLARKYPNTCKEWKDLSIITKYMGLLTSRPTRGTVVHTEALFSGFQMFPKHAAWQPVSYGQALSGLETVLNTVQ